MKTIVVIGTGYVGLPAAILLAKAGYRVIGVDIDEKIVEAINNGVLHIDEAELQKLMIEPEVRKNLIARKEPCKADIFIVAVPTPLDDRKKICDMSFVISAIESIIPYIEKGNLVIVESTIPPLTCRDVITPMLEKGTGLKVGEEILLCHCPERILPGDIFKEIINNDRIIGGVNHESSEAAREIYAFFVKGNLYLTDDVTAELCKLMENTYRDVNIALANEFAAVAEGLGISVKEAIELSNKHPRVNILSPGIGVGGHCIPIDPWFIKEVDPENTTLIMTARKINDGMPAKIAAKIRRAVKDIAEPKIVALGASYKPNTYDLRESPALEVIKMLREDGYDVTHYDPLVEGMEYHSIEEAADGADCLVLLVEHSKILNDLEEHKEQVKQKMRGDLILRFYH